MMAALLRFRLSADQRWRELWRRNARHLLDAWVHHDDARCHLWTQHLYGEVVRLLGAGHGFAGNAFALLAGIDCLDRDDAELVTSRTRRTLLATAHRQDGMANWSPHVDVPRRGRDEILVQWCHGAPGMITSLARLPSDPDVDRIFDEAGELIWRAGPLTKGPGLCHGTAGNGYAFLKLYRRTGNPVWLERARQFASHAMEQSRRARLQYGTPRYSLWTGDLGLALYLADCAAGTDSVPTLDEL
jgi:lantibiotic modifying enzyme